MHNIAVSDSHIMLRNLYSSFIFQLNQSVILSYANKGPHVQFQPPSLHRPGITVHHFQSTHERKDGEILIVFAARIGYKLKRGALYGQCQLPGTPFTSQAEFVYP